MYEKFFQFARSPFNLTPDPHFFFFSRHHEEAFSQIIYGVQERKGFILITGEVGTGKTTLCRLLLEHLDPKVKTALVFNPNLTTIQLLQAINQDFGLEGKARNKKSLIDELNRHLLEGRSRGENAVVIIDEAQNLSIECLEEIRMLSNLETTREKLLQIVLVGQPELKQNLGLSRLRQLNQRISLRYHLQPLDLEMTRNYINFRLRVAGGSDQVHFTPTAVRSIYQFSQGTPRLINILCDKCLLAAYVAESRVITLSLMKTALADLEPVISSKQHSIWSPERRRRGLRALILASGTLMILLLLSSLWWWEAGVGFLSKIGRGTFLQALSQGMPQFPSPKTALERDSLRDSPQTVPPVLLETGATEQPGAGNDSKIGRGMPYSFDPDGIFRVGDPAETERAAYLTLARLWLTASGQEVAITPREFREMDLNRALEDWGLYQYPLPEDFEKILDLAYPALVWILAGEEFKPRTVVLANADPKRLTLLDPIAGKVLLGTAEFNERFTGRGVLFWREIPGISFSFSWDVPVVSIKTLQAILKVWGFYPGLVDGVVGPLTEAALKAFQKERGLVPTGTVGMETYLVLAQAVLDHKVPTIRRGGPESSLPPEPGWP